jgi:AcrR family transcriptional regulator
MYTHLVPRLWNETIEAHRRDVHDAILRTATALVAQHGLHAVTMSRIAEEAGIGRATLYKYFKDVEAILVAWHDRLVARHLEQLGEVRERAAEPGARLAAVLETYAFMVHERPHDSELTALVHRGEHLADAHRRLDGLIRDLLAEAATAGAVRDDVAPDELATYCLHSLAAASTLRSGAAVRRLVTVTLAGLRPPPSDPTRAGELRRAAGRRAGQ